MKKTHIAHKDQKRSCHCEEPQAVPAKAGKQSQCACITFTTALRSPRAFASSSLRALRSNLIVNALQSNRAFALVISLGLVALIMIVTINLVRDGIEHTRQFAEIEQTTEAYYAAEAALETGLLANKGKGPGYEARVECTSAGVCKDQNDNDSPDGIDYVTANGSYGTWTVQGRTSCLWSDPLNRDACDYPNTYIIPYPGTGTAGTTCDPLGAYPDADHACNWGKLRYGENVAIPLYAIVDSSNSTESTADTNGNNYLDPSEWGMTSLYIKVRTPCNPDNFEPDDTMNECDEEDRYVIDTSYDYLHQEGETLMIWEITGQCGGEGCYLQQNNEFDRLGRRAIDKNSEIFANRINNPFQYWNANFGTWDDFALLNQNFLGESEQTINDFLMDSALEQPILNLSIIYSLIADTLESIPYLEYQIELGGNADIAPSDVYQTIIGEGYSGKFKQSVEIKKGHKTGVLKFVIQN